MILPKIKNDTSVVPHDGSLTKTCWTVNDRLYEVGRLVYYFITRQVLFSSNYG